MKLIIGGAGQGKLALALTETGLSSLQVCDGRISSLEEAKASMILNHLEQLVYRNLGEGDTPNTALLVLGDADSPPIIICNEIGSGIVPLDPKERQWREQTGRLCCILAEKAARVERVFCGISTVIKEEG